jgi:hypothetical protein
MYFPITNRAQTITVQAAVAVSDAVAAAVAVCAADTSFTS